MKKVFAGIALSVLLFAGSGGVAFAGEVDGQGNPTAMEAHANSLCGFSGLEDGDGNPPGPSSGQTQTPAVVAGTGVPGQGGIGPFGFESCNPQDTQPGPGL